MTMDWLKTDAHHGQGVPVSDPWALAPHAHRRCSKGVIQRRSPHRGVPCATHSATATWCSAMCCWVVRDNRRSCMRELDPRDWLSGLAHPLAITQRSVRVPGHGAPKERRNRRLGGLSWSRVGPKGRIHRVAHLG